MRRKKEKITYKERLVTINSLKNQASLCMIVYDRKVREYWESNQVQRRKSLEAWELDKNVDGRTILSKGMLCSKKHNCNCVTKSNSFGRYLEFILIELAFLASSVMSLEPESGELREELRELLAELTGVLVVSLLFLSDNSRIKWNKNMDR